MLSTNFYYFAYGICCMFFLMLSTYFLLKGTERLKQLLGYILFLWFLLLIKDIFFLSEKIRTDPYDVCLLFSIDLLALPTGTFLLFELLKPNTVSWRTVVIHETPILFLILLYAFTQEINIYYFTLLFALVYGLSIVYSVIKKTKQYNKVLSKNYSNTDYMHVRWLKTTCMLLVACMFVWAFTSFYISYLGDSCYYFFCCCIWGYIALHTNRQETTPAELFEIKETAYPVATLPNLIPQLEQLLEEKKLYHNPKLTLTDVAKELGTNRTYLSACLNQELDTTFYNYINLHRLKEVEILFQDSKHTNHTIEELALMCGFNSISTFRRAFVKTYGCTPLQYRKKH